MQRYRNLGGDSGVVSFEIGEQSLVVEFLPRNGDGERFYRYTTHSAGASNLQEMQRLALAGRGLATFISRMNPDYESRWR